MRLRLIVRVSLLLLVIDRGESDDRKRVIIMQMSITLIKTAEFLFIDL